MIALCVFFLAGCASKPQPVRPVESAAFVVVENHTDFAWRVSLVPVAAATSAWREVAPREVVKLAFPPGVYRVRREIVAEGASGAPVSAADAAIDLTLAGGRTYTWPLATLFSNDGVGR